MSLPLGTPRDAHTPRNAVPGAPHPSRSLQPTLPQQSSLPDAFLHPGVPHPRGGARGGRRLPAAARDAGGDAGRLGAAAHHLPSVQGEAPQGWGAGDAP